MKYREDKDLEFLKNLKDIDLNSLVQILTEVHSEELTKREIYKEFKGKHNIYWEEIATEFQHFGGNSISNLVRGKGVLYAEILRDVCKSLNIEFDTYSSTKEIEEKLLSYERKENFLEKIKTTSNSLRIEDLAAVFVSLPVFFIKKLTDPAYRVTIKAIYEIANLRNKYNKKSPSIKIESNNIEYLEYKESFPLINKEENIEMGKINIIKKDSCKEINFYNKEEDKNSIIDKQLFADIFKGIISTPSETVELVFSPKVTQGLKTGAFKLIENRAIVIDTSTGKIKEHAKVITSGQGKQLLAGGYQLLSIAVAQSHLADIGYSLNSIKILLEQIKENAESNDKAQIQGSIEYLADVMKSPNIQETLNKNEVKNQIENIKRDFRIYKNKLLNDYDNLSKHVKNLKDNDKFGTENTFNDLKSSVKDIKPLKLRYELLTNLSLCILIINYFMGSKEDSYIINNSEFEDKLKAINKQITDKSNSLKSYFNLNDTIEERKKILELLQKDSNKEFEVINNYYNKRLKTINSNEQSIIFSLDENNNIDKYAIKYG